MLSGGNTKYSDPERQRIARATAPVEKIQARWFCNITVARGFDARRANDLQQNERLIRVSARPQPNSKKKHCNLSALVSFARTLWQPQQRYKERGMPYTAK
jgi:hypothetical protein